MVSQTPDWARCAPWSSQLYPNHHPLEVRRLYLTFADFLQRVNYLGMFLNSAGTWIVHDGLRVLLQQYPSKFGREVGSQYCAKVNPEERIPLKNIKRTRSRQTGEN